MGIQVLKFGGSSLGDAARIARVARILAARAVRMRLAVVVSAVGGVTDTLAGAVQAGPFPRAENGSFPEKLLERHQALVRALAAEMPQFRVEEVMADIRGCLSRFGELLQACGAIGVFPDHATAEILGLGEELSVRIMAETLRALGTEPCVLDARATIVTEGDVLESRPVLDKTFANLARFRDNGERPLLMAGFVGGDAQGKPTTLGRNGSDYSAALLAAGLAAEKLEIWTDVSGVYSTDPRLVPEAMLVPHLSYREAMELSYFGAKVLHPKTIAPVANLGIPVFIRNSLAPDEPGSVIEKNPPRASRAVRGISSLPDMTLLAISGPGLKGMCGMAARVFAAISGRGISVSLITQSSSEYNLSLCVATRDANAARASLEEAFELELRAGMLEPVKLRSGMAIVSLIGDGMRDQRGVAGAFFGALASAGINIAAIAQGSSERSISAVIARNREKQALNAVHRAFFTPGKRLEVFVFGVGGVGGELLSQIRAQRDWLAVRGVRLLVCGIANSKKMVLAGGGLDLDRWQTALEQGISPPDPIRFREFAAEHAFTNAVFVDCTTSEQVADCYPSFFESGFHVVAANKKANTRELSFYLALHAKAEKAQRRFYYSTNVGAGLPIIESIERLAKSGDRLLGLEGILSGSLSFIFGLLEEGVPFSEAVCKARDLGFTEPDPRDDLSGLDVARKLLILARETGLSLELRDVAMEPILPEGFDPSGSLAEFLNRLSQVDRLFEERVNALKTEGRVLRWVGTIANGRCRVGSVAVSREHPLYSVKGGENAVTITSERYRPVPLTVRGYGAGAAVTAAGVFADILKLAPPSRGGRHA